MTRGELERAYVHYVRWAEMRKLRDLLEQHGMILCPGDSIAPAARRYYSPDDALARVVIREIEHGMANEAQLLMHLGVDMRDEAPAA